MRNEYIVIKELKSPIKLTTKLYLADVVFVAAYVGIAYAIKEMVHITMQPVFLVFNGLMALILTSHTPKNPQKRFYHMIYYWLLRDRYVYHPISIDQRSDEQ